MIERSVTAADGRALLVAEDGERDGVPVLVHHGTPGCPLLYRTTVALAAGQGISILSYDRPGYGGSTRRAERTVADCADDVRTIAAALGIERLCEKHGSDRREVLSPASGRPWRRGRTAGGTTTWR